MLFKIVFIYSSKQYSFDHKTIENIWKIEDNRIHAGNTENYVNMSKPS